jgi:hypothetical protein
VPLKPDPSRIGLFYGEFLPFDAAPSPGTTTTREPALRGGTGAIPSQQHAATSMLVGEVFLETMATGIITQQEIDWLTTHQAGFSREEEAMALKIGRLLDEGQLQIGCRLLGKDAPEAHLAS